MQAAPTAAPTATTAAAAPSSLTLIASNLLFDKKELKAKAGSVTIELDNRDASVPHNLHVFSGSDATGATVGKTEMQPGPVKQSLALSLASFDIDDWSLPATGMVKKFHPDWVRESED